MYYRPSYLKAPRCCAGAPLILSTPHVYEHLLQLRCVLEVGVTLVVNGCSLAIARLKSSAYCQPNAKGQKK